MPLIIGNLKALLNAIQVAVIKFKKVVPKIN